MGKKDIMRELREDAEAWRKEQTLEAYIGILETIFNGLRENALIHVPFDFDPETRDGGPAAVRFEDETESLLIPVDLLEETKAQAVPITLRALVKELDHRGSLDGFWIDLGGKGIFIPKTIIKAGIGAGYQIAVDEIENEAEIMASDRGDKELVIKRPMPEERFRMIEDRVTALERNTDDFLKLTFLRDDYVRFLQVLRTDRPGERHLSFGFDMRDFGWDEPLVLGKALPTEKTIDILRRVCVKGEDPNNMKELEEFRKMG